MDPVIVVLDRADAQADVERLGVLPYTLDGNPLPVLDALRAALSADPDALIETVAKAIWRYSDYPTWELAPQPQLFAMARAALSAITEKAEG